MSSSDDRDDESVRFNFATTSREQEAGKINFDDRGNAVYEWKDSRLSQDSKQAERMRSRALSYAGLSLVDDTPAPSEEGVKNDEGLRLGYNPYQSGMLVGDKPAAKRSNMRELSKWIEMKRRLAAQKK